MLLVSNKNQFIVFPPKVSSICPPNFVSVSISSPEVFSNYLLSFLWKWPNISALWSLCHFIFWFIFLMWRPSWYCGCIVGSSCSWRVFWSNSFFRGRIEVKPSGLDEEQPPHGLHQDASLLEELRTDGNSHLSSSGQRVCLMCSTVRRSIHQRE